MYPLLYLNSEIYILVISNNKSIGFTPVKLYGLKGENICFDVVVFL